MTQNHVTPGHAGNIWSQTSSLFGEIHLEMQLLSGRARADTNVSTDISVTRTPGDLIQGSIMKEYFFLRVSEACIVHPPLFTSPDLKVGSQLEFPMLNDVVQVTPTREKLPPGPA